MTFRMWRCFTLLLYYNSKIVILLSYRTTSLHRHSTAQISCCTQKPPPLTSLLLHCNINFVIPLCTVLLHRSKAQSNFVARRSRRSPNSTCPCLASQLIFLERATLCKLCKIKLPVLHVIYGKYYIQYH